ncbi:MAG: hypothetical protein KDD36_14115 [Flavobacteriales bacterium]|nr:hypothetical protein [Flavobacteriales bacterium]
MTYQRTDKHVIQACAKAVKSLDMIKEGTVSNMDAFYIDTARDQLMKVIRSNGYRLSDSNRLVKA